jgi:hypothetical protein
MDSIQEYELYCHFCGIGKKTLKASSFEEAKQILEGDEHLQFDEIIRLTKPCWVEEAISRKRLGISKKIHHLLEYENWGSE